MQWGQYADSLTKHLQEQSSGQEYFKARDNKIWWKGTGPMLWMESATLTMFHVYDLGQASPLEVSASSPVGLSR